MKPIAYLMVERNNQTTYFQTTVPTREEKISHHAIPLYTKPEDSESFDRTASHMSGEYVSYEDMMDSHENQQEWLRNVRKTGY
jgi:hypothetical protein